VKLLRVGFKGLLKEIGSKLSALDTDDPEQLLKTYFYQSLIIIYEAAIRFAHRFADLAEKMAAETADAAWKKELLEIARVCRRVPENPRGASGKRCRSCGSHRSSSSSTPTPLGFDRAVRPVRLSLLYQGHKRGEDHADEALEILQSFWVKLSSVTKLRSWSQTRLNAGTRCSRTSPSEARKPTGRRGERAHLPDTRLPRQHEAFPAHAHRACLQEYPLRIPPQVR